MYQALPQELEIQWDQDQWSLPCQSFPSLCLWGPWLNSLHHFFQCGVVPTQGPPQVLTLSLLSQHHFLGFLENSLPSGLPFYAHLPNLGKHKVNFLKIKSRKAGGEHSFHHHQTSLLGDAKTQGPSLFLKGHPSGLWEETQSKVCSMPALLQLSAMCNIYRPLMV